jgi:hypothetical protein
MAGRDCFLSRFSKEKKTHPASGRLRRLFVCSFDFEFEDLAASGNFQLNEKSLL